MSEQTLRWRDRSHSWRHRSDGGFNRHRYEVAALDEATARSFVEQHHYSGSYPATRLRYGLFDGVLLAGVAVLSVPVRQSVLTIPFPGLTPYRESLELGRFVLLDAVPANAESWFLARAFELAATEGVRGIVSFSDPVARQRADGSLVFPGHVGTIYQASNAVYLGRSTPRTKLLLPDGTEFSARAVSKILAGDQGREYAERQLRQFGAPHREPSESPAEWLRLALTTIGARRVRHAGCHRYAFAVGTRAARRSVVIGLPIGEYPKRDDQTARAA